jgi:hypothetical protein
MRQRALLALALIPLAAACGGDDSTTDTSAQASAPAPGESTTSAPAPAESTTSAVAVETIAPSGAAAAVTVELDEWTVTTSGPVPAGSVNFTVKNVGEFRHELAVIQGDSYESLPLAASGAIDEAQLPTGALLGRSDLIDGGAESTLTLDIPAGNYVFVCNIAVGPNSHAKAGQVLSVVVS